MRCLVVDDSNAMRRIIMHAIRSIGYTDTIEASDGVEALDLCDDQVALVIADWTMPRMSGLELVHHLRTNPVTSQVPVLMMVTRGVQDGVEEAVQAGANGYILKPFTPQILNEKIGEINPQVPV